MDLQEKTLSQSQTDELIIPVDTKPNAIQLYAFLSFVLGAGIAYSVGSTLFELGWCSLIGVFFGVVGGVTASFVTEKGLNAVWVSDRFVHVSSTRIAFVFGGKESRSIDPTEKINVTAWHFTTRRRSRVPKGWIVAGFSLEQDDVYLPVYALIPPDELEKLESVALYRELKGSRRDYKATEDVRLAGEQRRLLMAETARSIDGVEMDPEHLDLLILHLQVHFPGWMPQA